MKCKPLSIGLNVAGNEVLYPSSQSTVNCSPAILPHFIDLGFNLFRILISWERLQPELAGMLQAGTTPSATVNFDADYVTLIQQFVSTCSENKVSCILQIVNGGWYDSEYNPSYINDGTSSCPENGYVYIDQPATTINGVSVVGPTTSQFVNMWTTLASVTNIPGNPYVRFGLGTNPTLDNTTWSTICNSVISTLRSQNIDNIIHVDLQNSDPTDLSSFSLLNDPADKLILNVNYYDDNNNGEGQSVVSSDDYVACAISTNSTWSSLNPSCDSKICFGDVRFDSGQISMEALPKFLNYVRDNISTYDSVCLYAIGGGSNLPSCYNLNYVIVGGGFVDQPQITTAAKYTSTYETSGIYSALSVNLATNPVQYTLGSPYGSANQSLSSGQLFLPFSPFADGIKSLTIECWLQQPQTLSDTEGYLFGCDTTFGVKVSNSFITFFYGNDSYVDIVVPNIYNDLKWHHYELGFSDNGIYAFIDGQLLGFSILKQSFDVNPVHGTIMGIRSNGKLIGDTNVAIAGNISGFAIWNTLQHTATFSIPTDYYSGMESNLYANFPFNGNIDCQM